MIVFKEVSYKNFLSTGNTPNSILLDRVPSAIITGQNGAGKSTILDALCFGLYGKPYRNIAKAQLINTVNEKGLEVTVEFEVNNVPYKVIRGIKPSKFEVWQAGNLINHDAAARDYQKNLEDVLGLNQRAFTQIVILGSARYQSFMDLGTNDRRVVIEEILDITVFSKMNSVLKTKAVNVDLEMRDNEYQKELLKTKISAQKGLIENLINRTRESEEKVLEEKKKVEAQIVLTDEEIAKVDSDMTALPEVDLNDIQTKMFEAKARGTDIIKSIKKLNERISFYETSDHCHACSQEITAETKEKQIAALSEDKAKSEKLQALFEEMFPKIATKYSEADEIEGKRHLLKERRSALVAERKTLVTMLSSFQSNTSESDEASITESRDHLTEYTEMLHKCERHHYRLAEMKNNLDICRILLKDDGIKSKIIKQYLPVMNKLINQYLDRMGANYSFNLDENFNEIIKSRYRDTFSYASFSEGEKQRIDLALMFTWREIAKLKNSVNTNLLVFDEVGDSSMDGEGTDVLWDIIDQLTDSNVFVISHKTSNIDKFTSHIHFEKTGNFSKIIDSKR